MGLLNYSFYILMVTLVYYLYTYQFPQWLKECKLSSLYLFIATYWIVSVLHMIMDRTPNWLWGKYKVIQQETIRDIDMIPIVFFNQLMLCAFTYFYVEYIGRGYRYGEISYMHALLEILSFYAVYDVVFYYGHRFLHIPGIYERYHKLHHLTKGSSWNSQILTIR
jgi:sterol desaturase/sphingolipid hydroxylase (fatty acid hydroxylase superfamily)